MGSKTTKQSDDFDLFTVIVAHLPALVEKGFVFGVWRYPQGAMPYVEYSPKARSLMRDIDRIKLNFDWMAWMKTVQTDIDDLAKLAQADLLTVRRLLTAHLRMDRFNEGHLLAIFESGYLIALLRRLKELTSM